MTRVEIVCGPGFLHKTSRLLGNAQVVVRRAELAEQSREEEEMAARVEAEVSRRVAEAIETEAIAARIQAKLKVTHQTETDVK